MKKVEQHITKSLIDELIDNYDKHNTGEFREITSSLDAPKDVLYKYTRKLEMCAKEYRNCKNCKSILDCKNQVNGFRYTPKYNQTIEFGYVACNYKVELDTMREYQKNIYYNAIPERIVNASIDDIFLDYAERFEAIEWLKKFMIKYLKDDKTKGLYLTGNFGCGKTYLVTATFNALAKKDIKSAIIFWPEYVRDLKASFDKDFKDKYDYVKKVPLLLIDDIGAENVTDWERDEIFCPLMQYRMENNLTTFFTSNLTLDQLESHFSKTKFNDEPVKARRIIERVKQMTDNIEMISKNLR